MLDRIFSFVRINRKLLLGKNASIVITSSTGVESTLDAAELATLDGVTATYLEINKLAGSTFATSDINNITNLVCSATGTMVSTGTSAATQFIFMNAAGTAITTSFHSRAHITTTASGTNFGVVSGITAVTNGAIAEITSGAFDFTTTTSGRLGINIVNGASTNFISFNMPTGKQAISPAIITS